MPEPRIDPNAAGMYSRDATAPAFGIELIEASPGAATVRMAVRPEMCNGLGVIHGGMTFLLADSAMAFASNSGLPPGSGAFAITAEIDWLTPARAGDVLSATAALIATSGRTRVWDVRVTDQADRVVAVFRGRTRTTTRHT